MTSDREVIEYIVDRKLQQSQTLKELKKDIGKSQLGTGMLYLKASKTELLIKEIIETIFEVSISSFGNELKSSLCIGQTLFEKHFEYLEPDKEQVQFAISLLFFLAYNEYWRKHEIRSI